MIDRRHFFGTSASAGATLALTPTLLRALETLCANRSAWFAENVPIEPIRFISGASPTALLFQIARFDTAVP